MLLRQRTTALAFVPLLAIAAACSAQSDFESVGSSDEAVTKVCGAATNGPVQGYDVSYYQGNFDWAAAKKNGVDFGYARISDGTGFMDPKFATNWAAMKSAGVLRGAYQFFEPSQDATAQANIVVKALGKLGDGDLPAMIDVEATGGQSGGTIAARVKTWLQIVEKGTGRRPFIYSGSYFWQDNVGDTTLGAYPFWIAAYGATCPSLPPGWKNWLFWQYSDGNGSLEHDVFNGTLAQLQAYAHDPNSPPKGYLDSATCGAISGWAQDPDAPKQAIDVELDFDGVAGKSTAKTTVSAGDTRQDLCTSIGSCEHGFSIATPRSLRDRKPHEVYAYGLDTTASGTDTLLTDAPKSFTCDPEPLPKMARRWVTTPAAFAAWGFDTIDVGHYTKAEIEGLPKLADAPAKPSLAQADDGSPAIWVIDGTTKRHVLSASLASWHFDAKSVVKTPASKLTAMTTGADWPADPILVQGEGTEIDVLDALPGTPPGPGPGPAPPTASDEGCNASGGGVGVSAWMLLGMAWIVARRRQNRA
ncbi:hypothetical protein BH09MYX1_BH09MYX1_58900 [soil metagenome]